MDVINHIKQQIQQNAIILYMKGSPAQPQCGFSARAVQALEAVGARFASVDILAHPEIRQHLPSVANWPTFPQLFINGELIGGSDIIIELQQTGELAELIQQAQGDAA